MRRSLIQLVSICATAVLLAGCITITPLGKETAMPTSATVSATPAEKTPIPTRVPTLSVKPDDLSGTQVTFLHPWSGESGRVMDLMIDEFNQSNEWGIHVITLAPGSTGLAREALNDSAANIDLAALPVSTLLRQDESGRSVLDLNPYVDSTDVGLSQEEIADFLPAFWNANLAAGKLYGIPAQQSASLLFYNATWAAELGYGSAPRTPLVFKMQTCSANALFRKDSDRSNDGIGGWIISSDADTLLNWFHALEASDLSGMPDKFNVPAVKTAFEYLYRLQKDSCAWPSRLPEPYDYFAARQALAYSGTPQDILPQAAAMVRAGNEDDWKVIAYPSEDGAIFSSGLTYGVFKSDEKKQLAAWLFIRWLSEPANQARLVQATGSFPLGEEVLRHLQTFKDENPRWAASLSLLENIRTLPAAADADLVRMVLEDAGVFLFRAEFTIEKIPELLALLDQTLKELKEYQP